VCSEASFLWRSLLDFRQQFVDDGVTFWSRVGLLGVETTG
jgi:hypothetical protein